MSPAWAPQAFFCFTEHREDGNTMRETQAALVIQTYSDNEGNLNALS